MPSASEKPRAKTPQQTTEATAPTKEAVDLLASLFQQVQDRIGPSRPPLEGDALAAVKQHRSIAGLLAVRSRPAATVARIPTAPEDPTWAQAPFSGAGPDRPAAAPPGKKKYGSPRGKTQAQRPTHSRRK